jgi:LemA protein
MARNQFQARLVAALMLLVASLSLASCGINSIPTAEETAKAKWANVQAQYQRRSDLIGNLVATVRAAAKQEQDTLVRVTEARARATAVQVSTNDLNDPEKVAKFQAAQGELSQSLGRLLVSVEAYPELKTNQNFLALQSQIEGTENRIAVAIADYNEAVRAYNTRIRTFPDIIGARLIFGSKPMAPFEAKAGAETAPDVGSMFNNNNGNNNK